MRLICPECAAQYEVDENVIPETGRDVQCSNCGHTWWQMREVAEVEAPPAPERAQPALQAEAPAEADGDDELEAALADAPDMPKRSLDDAVLDVLRQEAEREARAREQEGRMAAEAVRTVPPVRETPEVAAEPARPTTFTEDGVPIAARPRSARLPDIDEINSTLDGREMPEEEGEEVTQAAGDGYRRRRGFRVGFLFMGTLCAGLALIYAYADAISMRVPALSSSLALFTENVDQGRVWLDGAAVRATQAIQGLTSGE